MPDAGVIARLILDPTLSPHTLTDTLTIDPGIEEILVECWGPGGEGQGGTAPDCGRGGGGGEYRAAWVEVSVGDVWNLVTSTPGFGNTYFSKTDEAGAVLVAVKGADGSAGGGGGSGGTGGLGINGSNGGVGGNADDDGGGGGGGGTGGFAYAGPGGARSQSLQVTPRNGESGVGIAPVAAEGGGGVGTGGTGATVGSPGVIARIGVGPGYGGGGGDGTHSGSRGEGGYGMIVVTIYGQSSCAIDNDQPLDIRETTTTEGTGAVTLLGPESGKDKFSDLASSVAYYQIISDNETDIYEEGIGTYDKVTKVLTRSAISSLTEDDEDEDFYSLPAGTKKVKGSFYPVTVPEWPTPIDVSGPVANFGPGANITVRSLALNPIFEGFAGSSGTVVLNLPGGMISRPLPALILGVNSAQNAFSFAFQVQLTELGVTNWRPNFVVQNGRVVQVVFLLIENTAGTGPTTTTTGVSSTQLPVTRVICGPSASVETRIGEGPDTIISRRLPRIQPDGTWGFNSVTVNYGVAFLMVGIRLGQLLNERNRPAYRPVYCGRLSSSPSALNVDHSRAGGGKFVYYVPANSARESTLSIGHTGAGMPIRWDDYPVVPGWPYLKSIDLSIPSRIPFNYLPGKFPSQNKVVAGTPADIFACSGFVSSREWTLFYMNWGLPWARKDTGGVGHSLTQHDGVLCLDATSSATGGQITDFVNVPNLSEDFSQPFFGANPDDVHPSRFVYLGTVGFPAGLPGTEGDGFTINCAGFRCIWNQYNRIGYEDRLEDCHYSWLANKLMAAGRWDDMDILLNEYFWKFSYIDPVDIANRQMWLDGINVRTAGYHATALGAMRIRLLKLTSSDAPEILSNVQTTRTATPERIGESDIIVEDTATVVTGEDETPSVTVPNLATRVGGIKTLLVQQSTYLNVPSGKRWGFFGSRMLMLYNDNGVITEDCDGPPSDTSQNANTSYFRVIGEC